jgi:hypothetical protein
VKKTFGVTVIALLLVAILLVAAKSFAASETTGPLEPARYQLFQGTFTVLDGKNNRADKDTAVFLLDTSTGKVKRYLTGLAKDGKYFEEWLPTEK